MKVKDCIFFQMTKASQAGALFWSKKVEHLGVTASQAMVLSFLGEEDKILARSLGQKLQITSATMTGILDRLEKLDLIVRIAHPNDRRALLICLTKQGAQHAREIHHIMVESNKEFLNRFSSQESESFRDMLLKIQN